MTLQQCIGRRVRDRRMEQHWLSKDLAALVAWPPDYLSRFERGHWTHIDPAKLCALAQVLGTTTDYLLGVQPHSLLVGGDNPEEPACKN